MEKINEGGGSAPTPPTVAEALRRTRERIERGWLQGSKNYDVDGALLKCAQGHLCDVLKDWRDFSLLCHAAELLRRATGWDNVPAWNDAPGRMQVEVLAAFDKAIALAEAEIAQDDSGRPPKDCK